MPGPLLFWPETNVVRQRSARAPRPVYTLRFIEARPVRLPPPPTIRFRMTVTETMMPRSTVHPVTWRNDAVLGLAGALLALCLHAAAGFPTLAMTSGDNDSLLRLVEIRDLIGGQGWFDLQQYRMGPQGGFEMHWSRLVDAPIAAIILVVSAFTGKLATGETAALLVWPTLLMAATLTFMLRLARAVGDHWAL